MPVNTSSSRKRSCACDRNCGCCGKQKAKPGFFGRRPWLFVVFAFMLLFAAWGGLFYIAIKNRPASVPLTSARAPH